MFLCWRLRGVRMLVNRICMTGSRIVQVPHDFHQETSDFALSAPSKVLFPNVRCFSKDQFLRKVHPECRKMGKSKGGNKTGASRMYSKLKEESDEMSEDDHESEQDNTDIVFEDDHESEQDNTDSVSEDESCRVITPLEVLTGIKKDAFNKLSEKEKEKARRSMADELIRAALDEPYEEEEEDGPVPLDKQRSLRVGIIGAVNAGKSSLTNYMGNWNQGM